MLALGELSRVGEVLDALGAIRADDPAVARHLARSTGWDVDVASLAVGVVVWAYAGVMLVALLVVGLVSGWTLRGRTGAA